MPDNVNGIDLETILSRRLMINIVSKNGSRLNSFNRRYKLDDWPYSIARKIRKKLKTEIPEMVINFFEAHFFVHIF